MGTSDVATQPAAERRAAEAELSALIDKCAAAHRGVVEALRRSLRKRLPSAHEIVYEYRDFFVISYSPNDHGYEGVLGVRGSADGVTLWFNRGHELPDPEKLLKGSGKQVRSLDIESAATLARPAVARLIEAVIERNPVPFARGGAGSVVIRATSAKKRNEKPAAPARKKTTAPAREKKTTAPARKKTTRRRTPAR